MSSNQGGFTLIELMIVVLLIGLLSAMAVPNFIRSRTTTQTNVCINNLRAIDYAIQQWALESRQATGAPVQFSDLSSYLKRSVVCPTGGSTFVDSYSVTQVGAEPLCVRVPLTHLLTQTEVAQSGPAEPTGHGHGKGKGAGKGP
jgi:general secretion pathway protein G